MKEKIYEIIKEINPFIDFDDNTDLLEEGVLDSLGIMTLISEIEHSFGAVIELNDVEIDDFRNINSIMKLVGEKR